MARADTASASAHPDSIKGLAQSIAKPAYRRLLNAEPLLRRAVPVLIIAFLATICVGALVQVLDHRRQTLASEVLSLEAVGRSCFRTPASSAQADRPPPSSSRSRCLRKCSLPGQWPQGGALFLQILTAWSLPPYPPRTRQSAAG